MLSSVADMPLSQRGDIMKKTIIAALGAVLVTTVAFAYEVHHPNLKDAYGSTEGAIHAIQMAQGDNRRMEFGGHAASAIGHLRMAEKEIMAADRWNDAHHHGR
jgi:hypothetical protein